MRITEKTIRPLTETKYLSVENADRYRSIMRIFYESYDKMKYWLYQEEVYAEMIEDPYFADYKPEQCQQDLNALLEWKNLSAIQDARWAPTIEEFKNRKFQYQMTEYSVQIERLVVRLENLAVEGASLEPTLLERLRRHIERFDETAGMEPEAVYAWWDDLSNDFIRLNDNCRDYFRALSSMKAEEMMKTKQFLIFKDRLVEYLHSFVKGLQKNAGVIEENLRTWNPQAVEEVLQKVTDHEMSIPRLEETRTRETIYDTLRGRYENMYHWFVSENGKENEAGRLFDKTNDMIRRITRYASQISERNATGANRREEYRKVAEVFLRCRTMEEAHRLSAMVFGLEKPFHLGGTKPRETNSMNLGVFAEEPEEIIVKPRIREYREKSGRTAIKDTAWEKKQAREEAVRQLEEDRKKLACLERDGVIDFDGLPEIEPRVREILLRWISSAMEEPGFAGKTEDGRGFLLEVEGRERTCVIHCTDGKFTMPKMRIVFQ